jgi:hypothetical protein
VALHQGSLILISFKIFPTSSSATLWQLEDEAREIINDLRVQERGPRDEPSDQNLSRNGFGNALSDRQHARLFGTPHIGFNAGIVIPTTTWITPRVSRRSQRRTVGDRDRPPANPDLVRGGLGRVQPPRSSRHGQQGKKAPLILVCGGMAE